MKALICFFASLFLSLALWAASSPWDEYAPFAQTFAAIEPTPTGEGHMGQLSSSQPVLLRFPVPQEKPLAYRIFLGNVVAYTGKGQSYQLIVRSDTPDGPVVHQGPVIANGDAWNESNRQPIDVTEALSGKHLQQGYLDIYITGIVSEDGWTLYKHNPHRPITAQALILTPQIQKQLKAAQEMAARGLAVLPQPQHCVLSPGDVVLAGFAREAKTATERFLYEEINERVRELGLPTLQPITQGSRIWLCLASDKAMLAALQKMGFTAQPPAQAEGYVLQTQKAGVAIIGRDAAGLFYGVQTLRQLLQASSSSRRPTIPSVLITDWPEYPLRGWQYDLARGQTINMDFFKRLIRETARHKMNCIMIYMEGDYRFEKYPFLGRPGTLDKQKALALDAYAAQYYVQLIPQYEALGHASATLQHEELKDLRENGSTWVYCTSEPKTWAFLEDIFGELAQAFPHARYFHVGADEFEFNFGLCPRCQPKGIGPLYVEHMTKLNNICKKYGRKMLFWPSHHGPTEELSYLSLKHAGPMPKDCIPTEWIYHGPASYPEIAQYQEAGYEDVFVCPAVVDYSIIWPDYIMTFRGIKGFYEAGRSPALRRPCGGAICTTWELMYGGLYENSFYGLLYAAECGWTLGRTSKADFDRRFAADWLGIAAPKAAEIIAQAFYAPIPTSGEAALWRNGMLVQRLFWSAPQNFRRQFMQREPLYLQRAPALQEACEHWADNLQQLLQLARRNALTIKRALTACAMYRYVSQKLQIFEALAQLYAAAEQALQANQRGDAAEKLQQASLQLEKLRVQLAPIEEDFAEAVNTQGAFEGDLKNIRQQQADLQKLKEQLQELGEKIAEGALSVLPPAEELGLGRRAYVLVAGWTPAQMSEQERELRYDITAHVKGAGTYRLEFVYTRGAHGLRMRDVRLLCNGQIVAQDAHGGWAGAGSRDNVFVLKLAHFVPDAKYELAVIAASHGGTDSQGEIWMSHD